MATLTVDELLLDTIDAYKVEFPAINRFSIDWGAGTPLKKGKSYTAHIAGIPTVGAWDNTNGYNITNATGRSLLTDIEVTISEHPVMQPLLFKHLDAIQDDKNEYGKVIANGGYALAKDLVDNALADVTSVNFTQATTAAVADFDLDVIQSVTGSMNTQHCESRGRTLFVGTAVANIIAADTRVSSNDYYGQREGGNGYRMWTNVGGFEQIIEYPDFPTNNGASALTSVTATASTDVLTKNSHGLADGQRVYCSSFSAGVTTGYYYVRDVTTNTFKISSTIGGAAVDIGSDGTGGSVQVKENLIAFAMERKAFAFKAGIPDGYNQSFLGGLNIAETMSFRPIVQPATGIAMLSVGWQVQGTGDKYWTASYVYGKRAGRDGFANSAGSLLDYSGHRIISA